MEKIKIVALVGKSSSGKTTLFKELSKTGKYHPIISSTTRPKRDYEVEGIDYHFVSQESFAKNLSEGKIIAPRTFKETWHYGIFINDFDKDKVNLVVVDPPGLAELKKDKRFKVWSVYLELPKDIRIIRSRERGDNAEEIIRRLKADDEDFLNIEENIDFLIFGEHDTETLKSFVLERSEEAL